MENQTFTEIRIEVNTKDLELAEAIANMVVPWGIYIEDYSSLEQEAMEIAKIDMIADELLNKNRTVGIIHIYLDEQFNPLEEIEFLKERFSAANIDFSIEQSLSNSEEWRNNWKKFYHTLNIGTSLLIQPLWEKSDNPENRKVLRIDPGLAFGTGSHPTTRLCLEKIEKYVNKDSHVLDVGCGSGILSIASLLLGAKDAFGVDIDDIAVKAALENAKENNFVPPVFNAVEGDLLDKTNGKYNLILANIVADVIINLNPQVKQILSDDGIYIVGGIIDIRKDEVEKSLVESGFEILEKEESASWHVYVLKHNK